MPVTMNSEIPADVVTLAGPLLVGYLLSWGLYGVLSVQVYIYYLAFPKDLLYAKFLVYGVYLLETAQSIIVAHDAFKAYAEGFGSFMGLTDEYFTWLTMPIIGGVVACIVQFFYAYRIGSLSNSRIPATFIAVLSIIQCCSAITAGILAAKAGNLLKLTSTSVRIAQGIWGGVSAGCDVAIAICMSYQLSKREAVFPTTQAIVVRILRLIIGTGSLTAAIAILNLALFNGVPHGAFFLTPGVLLGKLYSNSMMVILNSRLEVVGGRHNGTQSAEIMLRPSLFRPEARQSGQRLSMDAGALSGEPSSPLTVNLKVKPYGHGHTEQSQDVYRLSPTSIEIGVTRQTITVSS